MIKIGENFSIQHVLACDDIRQENTGKQILIGVYTNNVMVSRFPSTIQLMFLLRATAKERGRFPFEVRLLHGKTAISTLSAEINVADQHDLLSLATPRVAVQIDKQATLKFQMREPNEKWKTLLKLNIREEEKPT